MQAHTYKHGYSNRLSWICGNRSHVGLNLKGVLIKGQVELVFGEEAQKINRLIHLKYVTQDALDDPNVATYFQEVMV